MEAMSSAQERLWRAGSSTSRGSHSAITWLFLLESEPDRDRLTRAHEWAISIAPRLRDRVLESKVPTGSPVWTSAGTFRLRDHLSSTTVEGGLPELLAYVQSVASAPLDTRRPLWESIFVEGQKAFILRIHPSLANSVGGVALLERLLAGRPIGEHVEARETDGDQTLFADLLAQTRRLPRELTSLVRTSVRTGVATSVRIAVAPRRSATEF